MERKGKGRERGEEERGGGKGREGEAREKCGA